ncbi:hypothetical protein BDW59DRAFT_144411 [Aspergillus cavernicola]|uniref:Uncharacterized protein n=1 Tax=Aspergillus cavernicola TaxID=176166 RepID=A0ABR4IHH1_9EURO
MPYCVESAPYYFVLFLAGLDGLYILGGRVKWGGKSHISVLVWRDVARPRALS